VINGVLGITRHKLTVIVWKAEVEGAMGRIVYEFKVGIGHGKFSETQHSSAVVNIAGGFEWRT